MGLDSMKTGVHVLKGLIFSIKTCYRLVRKHPSILGIILIFYLLYRFLPSVFRFLLYSSPIFICTSVLLATLMALGHRDPPKVEEKLQRRYSRRTRVKKDDCIVEEKEITSVRTLGRRMIDIKDEEVEKINVAERSKGKAKGRRVTFSPIHDEGFISRTIKIDDQPKGIHGRNGVRDEKPLIQGVSIVDEDVRGESFEHVTGISDTHMKDCLKEHEKNVFSSDSVLDHTGSSSSKASMVTANAAIEELHPVLDSQSPQPVLISINEFDDAPEESDKSNDGSEESEAEKNEGEDKERDGTKLAVSWTGDDEKNLMDLGCSELERNQRLESLMARRRARKIMRRDADKNLIDFNCNDPPYQIAPLSIIRNNPFDHPHNENEIGGMPPIPGSAPSVLIPRKSPFDLPYDPQEEKPNLTGDSFSQEFMTVFQKDVFCRHESFCFGSNSLSGGLKQDKGDVRISAFFIPDDIASSSGQRQFSDTSDSILSSVPETDLQSSGADQEEEQKQVIEQEGELISNIDHSPNYVEEISQRPEVGLVGNHQEETRDVAHNKDEISLTNINEDYMNPDVVEEKLCGLNSTSSSPSSEMNENFLQENTKSIADKSQTIEPTTEGLSMSVNDSDLSNGVAATTVGDSIPLATENRTIEESLFCVDKGVVLTSFPSLCSFPSMASDLLVEVSEVGSPRLSTERAFSLTDGESFQYNESVKSDISSGSEAHWTASSGLCAVDENEAKSREVTEISEFDVIKAGLLRENNDSDEPIAAPVVIKSTEEQVPTDSNSASSAMKEPTKGPLNQIPASTNSNSASSAMKEPTEGPLNQIPASTVEPMMNVGYQRFDLVEDQIASSSSPAQILVVKSMVQPPPGDGFQHFTSSMKEITKEESTNQIQALSAEPKTTVGVHQLDTEEQVGSIVYSSSPTQILVERSTVQPSTSDRLQDSTLFQMKELTEVAPTDEISASIVESEMNVGLHQSDSEEKGDSIASSSLPSQVMVETSMVQPTLGDGLQHSTLTQMEEPTKEGVINHIQPSSVEPEIKVGVSRLDPQEVSPIVSSSLPSEVLVEKGKVPPPPNDGLQELISSQMKEQTEEGAINQITEFSTEPEMNVGVHLFNSMVQLPVDDAVQHSTSSQMKEPTKGDPISQIPVSSIEPKMNVGDEKLDSEEKVEPITSISSPVEHISENWMLQPLPIDGIQYSASSKIKEPKEKGVNINQIPMPSGEREMIFEVRQLDSEEKVEPTSSHLPVLPLVEKLAVQQPLNDDLHEVTHIASMVPPSLENDIHEVTQVSSMVHPPSDYDLHEERQVNSIVPESINGDVHELTETSTTVHTSPNSEIHEVTQVNSTVPSPPSVDLHEERQVSSIVPESFNGDVHEVTKTITTILPSPGIDIHEVTQVSSMVHPPPSNDLHNERQVSSIVPESLNSDVNEVIETITTTHPSADSDI